MKRLIYISALCLALSACAADTQNSSDEVVTTTTTITTTTEAKSSAPVETTKTAEKPKPKPAEKMAINAEVLSYKKGILTFKYEEKEYSLPFERKNFDNEPLDNHYPCVSESIIDNKYGETVNAKLSVNKDISEVFKCDVISPNGAVYHGEHPYATDATGKIYLDKDRLYSLKRKESTLCEIASKNESLEFDLNDLPMNSKLDYPEVIDLIEFIAYRFKDGKMILATLYYKAKIVADESGEEVVHDAYENELESFGEQFGFFGVIQSVSESGDKVTFLLNDKKTLCTVPTYYGDGGELKEGAEIMVRLKSDVSLFGSGGEHEFDYAVVYTDPYYFNQYGEDDNQYAQYKGQRTIAFDELAYSTVAYGMYFKYTKISEVE